MAVMWMKLRNETWVNGERNSSHTFAVTQVIFKKEFKILVVAWLVMLANPFQLLVKTVFM